MIQFLAWSGIRPGEMKALAWEDIDLVKGIAHVKYNINRAGQLKPPKTQAGIRKVELMPLALQALKEQRETTYMFPAIDEVLYLKHGKRKSINRRHVFLGRENKPYKRPELTTAPKQWATWLAKQMGHKDWGMIRKIYATWIDSDRPDHRNEIANNLGKNVP